VEKNVSTKPSTTPSPTPQGTFNNIKALIIKSADIVESYYEQINKKLKSEYVGISEFGTYQKNAQLEITANAERITQYYTEVQQIVSDLADVQSVLVENAAYIKTGKLEDGIYGVEVGRRTMENGAEIYNRYGRFTSNGLTFYDENGTPAAFITDRRLKCPNVVVELTFQIGGFLQEVTDDYEVIERWVR
jgi:hypothetical protein